MKPSPLRFLMLCALASTYVQAAIASTPSSCACIPHMDHPHVTLHSGDADALIFLPDPANGYYRAARFDWSGVVGCYAYKGHTIFGEWFSHYDPTINDTITGPVEEFRSTDGALGYDAAQPGGLFVKLGVGTLRKVADTPYKFGFAFPIVDTGHWTTTTRGKSVRFVQLLSSPTGVHYRYEKTLMIQKHGAMLTLKHRLTNLGTAPILTDVYDHDFFMLDGQPTGPGFTLRFPFVPVLDTPLAPVATLDKELLTYQQPLPPAQTAASYITGYSTSPSSYDFTLTNTAHHLAVEQTASLPVVRMYLWSIHTTICPEAYIHLNVPPGQSVTWQIHYRFSTP